MDHADIFARCAARKAAAALRSGRTPEEAQRLDEADWARGACRHCGSPLKEFPGHEPTLCEAPEETETENGGDMVTLPALPKVSNGLATGADLASRLAAYEAALDAQDRLIEYLDRCGAMGVAVAFDHALADRARESQPIGRLSDGTILYAHPRRRGRAPRAELREGAWILVDVFATEEGGYPIFPGRLPQPPPGWRTPEEETGDGPWDVAYPPAPIGG